MGMKGLNLKRELAWVGGGIFLSVTSVVVCLNY